MPSSRTHPPIYATSPAQQLPGSTLTVHFEFVHGAGLPADVIIGYALIISIVIMCHRLYGHAVIALRETQRLCAVPAQDRFILHPVNEGGLTVSAAVQLE